MYRSGMAIEYLVGQFHAIKKRDKAVEYSITILDLYIYFR